jgi:hypothetical protein
MAANPMIAMNFEDQIIRQHNQLLARLLIAITCITVLLTIPLGVLIFRPRTLPYLVMVNGKASPSPWPNLCSAPRRSTTW